MKTILVKGVEHHLKLGVAGCRKVEEKLGKSIFEAMGAKADGSTSLPTIGNLSVLFWGSLLHEDPTITQERSDALLDDFLEEPENDLSSVIEAIQGALNFTKAPQAAPIPEPAI